MHSSKPPGRTVFLDRDGVINVNRRDYVRRWEEFEFLPRALEGLALLTEHGCELVIVTNQSVVSRGLISSAELDGLHVRMLAAIASHGGAVRAVLSCPHRAEEGCACRKPRPGLLFQARDQLGIELTDAIVVGDHPTDIEAGRRAGCRSVLVLSGRTGKAADLLLGEHPWCTAIVPDLLAAAEWIVSPSPALAAFGSAQDPGSRVATAVASRS
jgi:D-glycero-D-manno-heptose 1,7-bisphosphate phosphatase